MDLNAGPRELALGAYPATAPGAQRRVMSHCETSDEPDSQRTCIILATCQERVFAVRYYSMGARMSSPPRADFLNLSTFTKTKVILSTFKASHFTVHMHSSHRIRKVLGFSFSHRYIFLHKAQRGSKKGCDTRVLYIGVTY